MKKLLLALCTTFWAFSTLPVGSASAASLVYWYTPEGESISLQQAVSSLQGYDVIMFGEYHDQTSIHQEQLAFLHSFYALDPQLALALEMIEKDDDELLQKYLQGNVTEDYFLAQTRPWKNYREAYAPLVNFCKDNQLGVIAANIPRYLASQYAKEGTLDNIAPDKQQYLPRVHIADKDRYFEEFSKVMTSMGQNSMQVPEARLWNFYRAQCLKDDVMAQSIYDYLQAHPEQKVIHMQGSFHGRFHLGVADKLQRLSPQLKIAVISPVYLEAGADKAFVAQEHREDGDLLLLTKQSKQD